MRIEAGARFHRRARERQRGGLRLAWRRGTSLGALVACLALAQDALAWTDYYVDATGGDDTRAGTSPGEAWKTLSKVRSGSYRPGDAIYLRRGRSWNEVLELSAAGTRAQPLKLGAYGSGAKPIIYELTLRGDYWVVEDIMVDHRKQAGDALRLRNARHCVLRRLTVRNGLNDGIDVQLADGVLIEDCLVHHFLAGSFTNQVDAHGITATRTDGVTIRRTEVHHVSGDSFQSDPSRTLSTPSDNILIEDCHFWTSPLDQHFNEHWRAGERPGENAIDTKICKDPALVGSARRMRITLRNVRAHGWKRDGYIDNKAAFNLKEKIEAVFDGVTVYDCEIAFRLRGSLGNAIVALKNAVIYDCEKAVRAESNLHSLQVLNCTFGENIGAHFELAPSSNTNLGTWSLLNTAFVGSAPFVATDRSNRAISPSEFLDSRRYDYRPRGGSLLLKAGLTLSAVPRDRDGKLRTTPYDVGAYQISGTAPPDPEPRPQPEEPPAPPAPPVNLRIVEK
jgi:hypothetical protein